MKYNLITGQFEPAEPVKFTCAVCGKNAESVDGKIVRTCEHEGQAVFAAISATVYGESKLE